MKAAALLLTALLTGCSDAPTADMDMASCKMEAYKANLPEPRVSDYTGECMTAKGYKLDYSETCFKLAALTTSISLTPICYAKPTLANKFWKLFQKPASS